MTWPRELNQLDDDLAAGRLSPGEYLRRRDQLLSGVDTTDKADTADTFDTSDKSDPPQRPTGRPAEGPALANPFPPAFRWESATPNETTTVIRPVPQAAEAGNASESTQIVPPGDVPDSERTQVVQARPFPSPAAPLHQITAKPPQQDPRQGWDPYPGADSSAPPWTVSDPPPIAEQQRDWMRQGPETFQALEQQPRTKQIIGIVVVAVLVLAVVGSAVAYFLSSGSPDQSGGDGQQTQQPAPPPAQTTTRELPAPPAPSPAPTDTKQALIEPPGQPRNGGGLLDLPKIERETLLPRPIVNALHAADMTDGVLKTTTRGENTIAMFAFTVRDEQAATDVSKAITNVQRDGGLQEDEDRAQQGVKVLGTGESTTENVYRAVYVLYDRVVFFEVFGPNRNAVLANFDSLLDEQVTHAPPTVR